jgi:hypothetical protein
VNHSFFDNDAMPSTVQRSVLWIDLHAHKNGGTSTREAMRWLYRRSDVAQLVLWDRAARANLRMLVELLHCNSSAAVELHEHRWIFFPMWIPMMHAMREAPNCTRPLLTTRVREPLSFYLSLHRWANIAQQFPCHACEQGSECMAQRSEPSRPNISGECEGSFLRWAAPNMQATTLLLGDFRSFEKGTIWSGSSIYEAFNENAFARLSWYLQCRFDAVYTIDRMGEMTADIAHRFFNVSAGFDEFVKNSTVFKSSPAWGRTGSRYDGRSDRIEQYNQMVCPDMKACRDHIEAIAPYDVQLYALAKRLEASWLVSGGRDAWRRGGVCDTPEPKASVQIVNTTREETIGSARKGFRKVTKNVSLKIWY